MRRLLPLVLLAALAGTLLVAAPAISKRKNVEVGDNYFVRKGSAPTVSVKRGDTVVWQWDGRNPHNVRVTSGPARFRSSVKTSGSYKKKVTKSGTYKLICDVHPPNMRMTLKVRR
jgi:plastocyanin